MGIALYIKTGNEYLTQEVIKSIEVLDCRCINDFCSIVGDALIGDLKDENGTPYYRLYSPAGKLLLEFKNSNPESFDILLSNWYNVLTNLLQNGNKRNEKMKLSVIDDFSDWLLRHENEHFAIMGQVLKDNYNTILLSRKDLLDSIIPSIIRRIRDKCSFLKDNIRAIVFSDDIKADQSYITNKLCLLSDLYNGTSHIPFYNLCGWKYLLEEELQERIINLDDCKAFKIDNFVLGDPIPTSCNYIESDLNYKGGNIEIVDGICESISARKGTEAFQVLISLLFPPKWREIESQSFSECHHLLNPLGFEIKCTKLTMNKDFKETSDNLPISALAQVGIASAMIAGSALMAIANFTGQIAYREYLEKDTPDFTCKLMFFSDKAIPGDAHNLGMRRRMPNTLHEISISIKRKA